MKSVTEERERKRTAHLHHDRIVDEEGQDVHEHDVVGGGEAEQQAQRVEGAVGEAVDLHGDGDDNGSNHKRVPAAGGETYEVGDRAGLCGRC